MITMTVPFGVLLLVCSVTAPAPTQPNTYWYYYFNWRAQAHLRAMTIELLKDVEYKMRYADFIFASYGGKIDPQADKIYSEVAYLQSSINKRFRLMCTTYREHTRIGDYMAHKFNEHDMLNANHLVQSSYHEILVLRDLLNKALDKKEALQKKERAMQFFMEFKRKEKTHTPKSRTKGSREPAMRRAGGDDGSVTKDLEMINAEKKVKEDLRKKMWMQGYGTYGMNDSAHWNEYSKDVEGFDFQK